jgi:hypothetical protein
VATVAKNIRIIPMSDLHAVHEIEGGDVLVWLDKNGDYIWVRTNEPYNDPVEIRDVAAVPLANILINMVQSRQGEPGGPPRPSCITEGDKGFGKYYGLPDRKIVFWDLDGHPVMIQTKYPDNVPIRLSFQEAFEFAGKLIDITREGVEERNEWIRQATIAQEASEA